MAKTLEEGEGFKPRQKQFLELVSQNSYLNKNFYLTGGTALAVFYLHHRESYDLDLFLLSIKNNYDVNKLRMLAKAKFDWDIDPIRLSQIFLKVGEYQNMPKMSIPFNRKNMDGFFLSMAKSLEREIFK